MIAVVRQVYAEARRLLKDASGSSLAEFGVLMAAFVVFGIVGLSSIQSVAVTTLIQSYGNFYNLQLCPPGSSGCVTP